VGKYYKDKKSSEYMKIMLTSAGINNKSLENSLKKLCDEEIKIAFIPTAANMEKGDKSWLIDDLANCKKLGVVDVVDIAALEKKEWLSRLKSANVIFMGGGDTTYLMNEVRRSGLADELRELLETRVYVGISAGSIIMSDSIQTSSEYLFKLYDDEVESPPEGLGFIEFGMRPHLNSPHFPKVNDENLKEIFRDSGSDIYALDDNSAVIWNDGKIEVVSEGTWIKYPK